MSSSTHITVVLDRSGSMHGIADDIIGGFNAFLAEQQRDGDGVTLTLVQFDTEDSYEVIHSFKPVAEVPPLTAASYRPRGGTPLLDAMGRTIVNLGNWIHRQPAEARPGRVMVVFITDGQENSSREFTRSEVKRLMKVREEESDWQFVFLSADLDAIEEAGALGIKDRKRMAFDKTKLGVHHAFQSAADLARHLRYDIGMDISFTKEDRDRQKAERERT